MSTPEHLWSEVIVSESELNLRHQNILIACIYILQTLCLTLFAFWRAASNADDDVDDDDDGCRSKITARSILQSNLVIIFKLASGRTQLAAKLKTSEMETFSLNNSIQHLQILLN
uniref:Uncharacterized protein n=1 Tax=Glossina pallidipes TaxID=7398 RepID=A0A1A9ZAI6_GLOPL